MPTPPPPPPWSLTPPRSTTRQLPPLPPPPLLRVTMSWRPGPTRAARGLRKAGWRYSPAPTPRQRNGPGPTHPPTRPTPPPIPAPTQMPPAPSSPHPISISSSPQSPRSWSTTSSAPSSSTSTQRMHRPSVGWIAALHDGVVGGVVLTALRNSSYCNIPLPPCWLRATKWGYFFMLFSQLSARGHLPHLVKSITIQRLNRKRPMSHHRQLDELLSSTDDTFTIMETYHSCSWSGGKVSPARPRNSFCDRWHWHRSLQ